MLFEQNNHKFVGEFSGRNNQGLVESLSRLQEAFSVKNLDYIKDISTIVSLTDLNESYKDILLEDYAADTANMAGNSSVLQEKNFEKLEALMEMARTELISESSINTIEPIVGLTFPLLKLYWIKNIFKDFIPTVTSDKPAFVLGLERRYVQFETNGKKWYLPEAYEDPTFDLSGFARKKLSKQDITVPQLSYNILQEIGKNKDHIEIHKTDRISISTHIDSIKYDNNSGFNGTIECRVSANPSDGTFKYELMNGDTLVDILQGTIDFEYSTISATSVKGVIKSFTLNAHLSSENHQRTPMVGWEKETRHYVIPDGNHVATGITRERIKDEQAIYNIDATAKIMEMMYDVVAAERDKNILKFLDMSKERMRANGSDFFISEEFDFAPPARLSNVTNTEWVRVELKETLDKLSEDLGALLRNETCVITVLGNPKDIRALSDISWTSTQGGQEIGGCKLDYNVGLYNGQRNYVIGSSLKIPQGKIRILLFPQNQDHLTYKIWEYQFIVSNEYRRSENYAEPSVMVSDRYLIDEHTPIQGELVVKNNKNSSSAIFKDSSSAIENGDEFVAKLAKAIKEAE